MSKIQITDDDLLAYLDEMLPPERSAQVEQLLRTESELRHRAALISRRRDQGGHTIGEIWRRKQLSCLTRETLGTYLLGVAEPDLEDYIIFHTQVIGCRICLANLADLQELRAAGNAGTERQKRYLESSAGLFRSQYSGSHRSSQPVDSDPASSTDAP